MGAMGRQRRARKARNAERAPPSRRLKLSAAGSNVRGVTSESFDPAGLLELGGRDDLSEFTGMFSAQMAVRLPELSDAIAHDDPAAVHRIAHGLKGSAATVGTPRVMQVCDAICKLAKNGSCVGAAALHAELVVAWDDAARSIADFLEATPR
jgi:HPt (histidine-containing phosphotransfer) domain-containing protein